ncbi:plasmalemma vesicle associated protein a [Pempheris klunzingeri]|uniref:plasmalemma vesicle associated protein a n=1 Tax=Pempheris klunzingeri TaxID=3127111 RepID=UPI0039817E20
MYKSDYSQVSKYSSEGQKKMQYRSKGKSCGYYMRIVFFFSSLIQSLIIVSLVLFLIYGKTQDSASTARIQDLEESFSRLSIENVGLRLQRKNLTNLLNTTLMEKARNDWDLAQLRYFTNISAILIQDIDRRLTQCSGELFLCRATRPTVLCPPISEPFVGCNCGLLFEQLKARLELVESNFTQTRQRMRMEMDQTAKERDTINLEVIRLRREKSTHEKEVDFFKQKCKDDFTLSLNGISNVTRAFLEKIDSLFPTHIAFQLTCTKQREHLEQIRTNCSSLSREVEDRFQRYLNSVGQQVSTIQAESSRMKAENWRLSDDYRWCSQNRTGLIQQHKQNQDKLQRKHDEEKEKLLVDKMKLGGQIEVLENNVKYKTKQVEHLSEQIKQLNMTCMSKTGWNLFGGGGSSSPGVGQPGRTSGLSPSFGSAFNKPASSGAGSSSSSIFTPGSSSSIGSAFNKPVSSGAGSSSSSIFTPGSSSSIGSVFNKPASSGAGSSSSSIFTPGSSSSIGSVFNKPASSGAGSSSSSIFTPGSSSSIGSVFNKQGSNSGAFPVAKSSNNPTTNAKSSTSLLSSSASSSGSSSGSPSKSASSTSWFGFGSSSGQSKTGTGRGTSTGTGSSIGGRTNGGGTVSVAQHLKDLQRIINPADPEEKQDLSRVLG